MTQRDSLRRGFITQITLNSLFSKRYVMDHHRKHTNKSFDSFFYSTFSHVSSKRSYRASPPSYLESLNMTGSKPLLLVEFTRAKDFAIDKEKNPSVHSSLLRFTAHKLRDANFVVNEIVEEDEILAITLGLKQEDLEEVAETVELRKELKTDGVMDIFTVQRRLDFRGLDAGQSKDEDEQFFTHSETTYLIGCKLNEVGLDSNDSSSFEALQKFGKGKNTGKLMYRLEECGLVQHMFPLHTKSVSNGILRESLKISSFFNAKKLIRSIRDYYGEEGTSCNLFFCHDLFFMPTILMQELVAFYFAWLDFFTTQLFLLATIAPIIYVSRMWHGHTVDTCWLTPFFGVIMFICSVFSTRRWLQQQTRYSYEWVSTTI